MTTSSPTKARRKEALDLLVKDWTKVFKEAGKEVAVALARRRPRHLRNRSPRCYRSGETATQRSTRPNHHTPMTAILHPDAPVDRIGAQSAFGVPRRVRSLSDRTVAWLFVGPTIVLLLAIKSSR